MNTDTKPKPTRKQKTKPYALNPKPVIDLIPMEDRLFAAYIVVTDCPAKAFKTLRPKTQPGGCLTHGTLRMKRPGVLAEIARIRALFDANKAAIAGLSLEEADRDMIDTLLAITRSPDASSADKAKAATSYVALRKGLANGTSGDTPQAGDMSAFLKRMAGAAS